MDTSDWMPTQGSSGTVVDPSIESGDWRAQLQPDSRQRIVNKIMETLKKHLPFSGQEGLQELKKIALKFEEKIYTSATSQPDYLRKISVKMMTMESRSQNSRSDAMQSSSVANNINPSDSAQHMQGSSSLSSALPPGSGLQHISGGQQNTVGPSNFVNQRVQQPQQQTPNSHYFYQQQLHQMAKQKLQQPSMQSHIQQTNLIQPSQQSVIQPAMMQTPSLSSGVQTQQPAVPQSSQPLMNHQQLAMRRQQVQSAEQQVQQGNAINMQQNQLMGQQNNYSDMQQQRLISQQNKLSSLRQPQQQLSGQHNNLSSMQQQQSGNSNMQTNQHSVFQQQILPSNMPMQQQSQHISTNLLPAQLQQSLTQFSNPQRHSNSGVFQQQNASDQQGQLFQQQRAMPEASSDSTAQTENANGGEWQEEVYQKIKALKDLYLQDLNDMYQKILGKLQQYDSLPQQPKNDQLEKLKMFKTMLERFMCFLQTPKHGMLAAYKDKLGAYEKQIIQVINSHRRKPAGPQQQAQQTLSQFTQVQSDNKQMNLHGSMAPMQLNKMGNLQQSTAPSLSGGSNVQQNMLNPRQPSSSLDPGQNSSVNCLQQVSSGLLQQNTVSGPQQVNTNMMSLQGNSNMLQHQHIKQEHLLENHQLNQFQQRQMHRQFLHKQQLLQQQFHQQTKQQQPYGQMQGNQLSQLHQLNDGGDIKLRQQMSVKSGALQQHYHQQSKPGAPFSPQTLSSASPQMSQHASPQVDQSNMLKSAGSPFTVPSPSTPSASSIPGNTGHQQPSSAVLPAQSPAIGTPGISASPLLAEFSSPDGNLGAVASVGDGNVDTEQPLDRLLRVVKSISRQALTASVGDIGSVVNMTDTIAGSAPGNGSRAAVGEDLVAMTNCHLQSRNPATQDATNGTRKLKRFTTATPLDVASSAGSLNDSVKQMNGFETSELDSTACSSIKRPRIESNHALLEEIKEINRGLINTVVSINDEDVDPAAASVVSEGGGGGTVVTCSYSAVALGPNLKSQYASAQMSPILPLRLLVPANYPNCSPILLDKFTAEVSKEFEDISTKTRSRFMMSLRSVSQQPMSLKEVARTWDACASAVISEYAEQCGGGTFSFKYGTWDNCLSAA